jgi:hypothetical protein
MERGSVYCIEVTGSLVVDYTVRDYCTLPYPGHPEGCPHFGKRKECPPHAPFLEDFIDLSRPHYFMVAECMYEDVCTKRLQHGKEDPEEGWSFWEGYIESVLCERIQEFQQRYPGTIFTLHPSAVGVDVVETARKVGISLEIAPKKIVHKIALIGYPAGTG